MLNKIQKKIVGLVVLFVLTSVFAFYCNSPAQKRDVQKLSVFFESIDGYQKVKTIWLVDKANKMLKLDDYIYADYQNNDDQVNLYIGYYYTSGKAYASHSPTVCYPSQGWTIEKKPLLNSVDIGNERINYEEVITSYGNNKELVLYWYQARLYTNTQVYMNKIDMAVNKMLHNDEHHAFVRVSVPFMDKSYAEAKTAAVDFIRNFYPKFVQFLTEAEGK